MAFKKKPRKAEDSPKPLSRRERRRQEREERRNSPEAKARRTKLKIGFLIVALILVFASLGITVGAYRVSKGDKIFPKIYVDDIHIGGMTKDEALKALEDAGWNETISYALRVKLPADVSFKLDMVKAGAVLSPESAVEAAYAYGHGGNWYKDLSLYIKNSMLPLDVNESNRVLNEEYILDRIAEGMRKFDAATGDSSYVVDREKQELRFMKGGGQMKVNQDALYTAICNSLLKRERLLDRRNLDAALAMPDFQAIYDELAVEPKDAEYTEKFEVIEEVVGCSFDIDAAKQIWEETEAAKYVRIPLIITQPEVTAEELQSRLFRDRLGRQTTLYTYSNNNRCSNISLAASKLHGLILYPGEVFSFNDTIGKRTLEAGFKEAGAYADGQVVQEIGGGICQVSSTLYCASMYAQMETVSRTNHYFRVDYLPISYDAAVSWTKPDFQFKNVRDYPVKIAAYADTEAKSLTIEIWGTDTDGSYVELSYWHQDVYDEEYTDVVIGEAAICYRHVYNADGVKIKTIEEPYSLYYLHEEDIEWPDDLEDDWVDALLPDEPLYPEAPGNSFPATILPIQ